MNGDDLKARLRDMAAAQAREDGDLVEHYTAYEADAKLGDLWGANPNQPSKHAVRLRARLHTELDAPWDTGSSTRRSRPMTDDKLNQRVFADAWKKLCQRFGRALDADEARAYHRFLASRMDTSEFEAAAEAVWATREFFPRPIDFLSVSALADWPLVLELALSGAGATVEDWARVGPRARAALKILGGSPVVRQDALRARAAFEAAVEMAVLAETKGGEAARAALPPGEARDEQLSWAEMIRRSLPPETEPNAAPLAPRSPTS